VDTHRKSRHMRTVEWNHPRRQSRKSPCERGVSNHSRFVTNGPRRSSDFPGILDAASTIFRRNLMAVDSPPSSVRHSWQITAIPTTCASGVAPLLVALGDAGIVVTRAQTKYYQDMEA